MRRADPLIMYGAPRSGTTYLRAIADANSDVFLTHETRVFTWAHRTRTLVQEDRAVLGRRARFEPFATRSVKDAIYDFYLNLAPDVAIWGDKNPHYAAPEDDGLLSGILEMFPGSRFIHIIRDGRDVASSLAKMRNPEGKRWTTFERAPGIWAGHVRTGLDFGRSLGPDQYFEIYYEDLITDDVSHARRLFDFIGTEMDEGAKSFVEGQADKRTPLSQPARDLAEGAHLSGWDAYGDGERARALEEMRPLLEECGYLGSDGRGNE